jgi:ArsR family transcriptional regulator
MRDTAQLFKAFSDETRLRMLALMQRSGELCVCDFERVLDLTQSTASRHLRHLYRAGLADHRRAGGWVYYRIRDELPEGHSHLLSALRGMLSDQAFADLDTSLQTWLREKAAATNGCAPSSSDRRS